MATLALSTEMLDDYSKLQKPAQAKVQQLAGMFRKMSAMQLRASKGIHLEKYKGQLDDRARTIRIDGNHRGIVLDAGNDETFVLVRVGTHDEVDLWMVTHQFKVNEATGALEVVNLSAIELAVGQAVEAQRGSTSSPLFGHRRDKDFTQLGISEGLLPALRLLTDEEQLLGLLEVVPQGQADALILLTSDDTVESIYAEVAGPTKPEEIDPDDIAAAVIKPGSRAQFHIVADDAELQEMLAQPLAKWRTYLHSSQEEAAYRPVYNGPARVTGGAGTGKTVVAMHRAKFLADHLKDRQNKPILFTTFTRNLAASIERDLRALGGTELLDVVEVVNVDSLAKRIAQSAEGGSPRVVANETMRQLWADAVDEQGLPFSPEFLAAEFEQVVLAHQCTSRSEYFTVSRAGRGLRLSRKERALVWKGIEQVTQELSARGERTHLQLASDAAGYLEGRTVTPYRHVIVDEAQDLHEAQWRLLRAAVAEGPNDMFIVGDSHQRIYDRRTSLSKVGINIRGRSRRLRINYRTTHEILRWALALLGEETYDDLDEGTESQALAEYHSFLHGSPPTMVGAQAKQEELDALCTQVAAWIEGGIPEEEIGVAARIGAGLETVANALKSAGVLSVILDQGMPKGDGVRLGTMHRMKGLEFRCVAIVDCDDDTVPLSHALTDAAADQVQRAYDMRRERCLLYVAATRARDDLWVGWSGTPSRFIEPMIN